MKILHLLALTALLAAPPVLTSCSTTAGEGSGEVFTPDQVKVVAAAGSLYYLNNEKQLADWTKKRDTVVAVADAADKVNAEGLTVEALKPILLAKLGATDKPEVVLVVDLALSFLPAQYQTLPGLNNRWVAAVTAGLRSGVALSKPPAS